MVLVLAPPLLWQGAEGIIQTLKEKRENCFKGFEGSLCSVAPWGHHCRKEGNYWGCQDNYCFFSVLIPG